MRTVSDIPIPKLRDGERLFKSLYASCSLDTVFNSRRQQWCAANPGKDGLDYLYAVLKPSRDAGTLPASFANLAAYTAFVLGLPSPPTEWSE